jgi:hypothetical protein
MMSFEELAKFLAKAAERTRPELLVAAGKIGEIEKKMAVDMIGRENPGWPPLAESTIAEKERLGYPSPAPLLRTGTLRESISFEVESIGIGVKVVVGSDDLVALYQELGTPTIPPRPFLSRAVMDSLPESTAILGHTAVNLLTKVYRI